MTEKQFIQLLDEKDIRYFRSGENIVLSCPFHIETTPSCSVNLKKGGFNCFGCEAAGTSRILIKKILGEDIEVEIEDKEKELLDLGNVRDKLRNIRFEEAYCLKIKVLINANFDDYDSVFNRREYMGYLKKRKINYFSCKKWNIRCGLYNGIERVLVPLYDEYFRLISILGRAISTKLDIDKRSSFIDKDIRIRKSKSSDVGKILFGLQHLKSKLGVLVEGEFDAIYLQQFGIPAVALGTKKPTEIQLMKMVKNFEKVYLSLDGDIPLKTIEKRKKRVLGINDIVKTIREYIDAEVIKLPENKDPNDLNKREIFSLYKNLIKERR